MRKPKKPSRTASFQEWITYFKECGKLGGKPKHKKKV